MDKQNPTFQQCMLRVKDPVKSLKFYDELGEYETSTRARVRRVRALSLFSLM